ncbi:hypothetical protein Tco_0737008 [Tanacetum coccineum]
MFRGTAEHYETETPLVDPDDNQIDYVNKVQIGVHYPAFDPDIPWDKMEPTLGINKNSTSVKVHWQNYDGKIVEDERCAGKKGNKDRVMKNKVRSGVHIGVKKKVVRKKVDKKKVVKKKLVSDSMEGIKSIIPTSQMEQRGQIRESQTSCFAPFRIMSSMDVLH